MGPPFPFVTPRQPTEISIGPAPDAFTRAGARLLHPVRLMRAGFGAEVAPALLGLDARSILALYALLLRVAARVIRMWLRGFGAGGASEVARPRTWRLRIG